MTDAFVDAAELMARARGVPGYPFAVIAHPISSATRDELAERALDAVVQAEGLLTAAAPMPEPSREE
jgi:hypothetical protein